MPPINRAGLLPASARRAPGAIEDLYRDRGFVIEWGTSPQRAENPVTWKHAEIDAEALSSEERVVIQVFLSRAQANSQA